MKTTRSPLPSVLLAAILLPVVASACAQTGRTSRPGPAGAVDTVYVSDTVRIETEAAADAQLEAQVARLQIQLLEKEQQLQSSNEELMETRQEVVRNLAKLQSQASRAEAASGLSEAEIALEQLGRRDGGRELSEFVDAQALIAEGSTEFTAENYGGALYLATQARTIVRSAQSRLGAVGDRSLIAGETIFSIPVSLRTVSRSNVRSGPGLNFDVQFTLDPDVYVVGQSYTSQWVRVVDGQGREGWVFHTLVTGQGN